MDSVVRQDDPHSSHSHTTRVRVGVTTCFDARHWTFSISLLSMMSTGVGLVALVDVDEPDRTIRFI